MAILHASVDLLLCNYINTTTHRLDQYEPSSPSTKGLLEKAMNRASIAWKFVMAVLTCLRLLDTFPLDEGRRCFCSHRRLPVIVVVKVFIDSL